MATAIISRWARRFLLVGLGFLVASQVAVLAGLPRSVEVLLGLQGFVLTIVFGKAYSLVPSYFDRTLALPRAPAVHLPVHVLAVGSLAASAVPGTEPGLQPVGAVLWAGGVAVFVVAIGLTIRSNPFGLETGTSDANISRAGLDLISNLFMPLAVAYLLVGSYEVVAGTTWLPSLLGGSTVRRTHLLAAGFALLLLFSVGYRLLPRFLAGSVPRAVGLFTLPAGALGPALLAVGYPSGPLFVAGAVVESVAVVTFAVAYGWLFHSTDRERIGFYGPLGGILAGLGGVGLGLHFALVGFDAGLARSHLRLNVFGLLGLSVLGIIYQFYPPAVAAWPASGDRLALTTLGTYSIGLVLVATGPAAPAPVGSAGHVLLLVAGLGLAYCLAGTIHAQTSRR